jgi:hypothetical protein
MLSFFELCFFFKMLQKKVLVSYFLLWSSSFFCGGGVFEVKIEDNGHNSCELEVEVPLQKQLIVQSTIAP